MNWELITMIFYLLAMVIIGVYFFVRTSKKQGNDKDYFLGGRNMGGWVAALSAGASDMSAWVLMGLPGAIYLLGFGQIWISVGLLIGTVLAWIFIAPRLRRYSIRANDSITVPQFLANRFLTKKKGLQVVSAVVFLIVYCVYAASSIKACGDVFHSVVNMDANLAMIIATVVILIYTFLGGFSAVCWTDFFQGLMMLAALMITPIIALFLMKSPSFVAPTTTIGENYFNFLESGKWDWKSISTILSGLGWGLGYAGMPHIIVRYMSIKSEKEMKKSQFVGCFWIVLILLMATVVGVVGRQFLGDVIANDAQKSFVFINMVRDVFRFAPILVGFLLSAILAASMSTADSQLLLSSSAFSSDVYKAVIRKKASNKELLWAGRLVVVVIALIAYWIASSGKFGGIMELVENAWGGFGASFGPVIILALFWKRLTYSGTIAGICSGFAADVLWLIFLKTPTGLYEIIPGFIVGFVVAVIVSLLTKEPSDEVCALFEEAKKPIG